MMMVQASNSNLIKGNAVSDLINQFVLSQDVRPSSKKLYKRSLRQYFKWVEESGLNLQTIQRADIIHYKQDLIDRGMSALTVSSYLTAVRRFYDWCDSCRIFPNVAKNVKSPKRKQAFKKAALTPEQTSHLLQHFKSKADGLRDNAIVNLMLRCGLRTIEVISADLADIVFRGGRRILLVQGKGEIEKNNFVMLSDKAWEPIRDYLETRPQAYSKPGAPLFISHSNNNLGGRLTTRTISKLVKDGLKAINIISREVSAHSTRHTFAVSVLRAGGTIIDVQHALRHANPATSQLYTKSIEQEMRLKMAVEHLVDTIY